MLFLSRSREASESGTQREQTSATCLGRSGSGMEVRNISSTREASTAVMAAGRGSSESIADLAAVIVPGSG